DPPDAGVPPDARDRPSRPALHRPRLSRAGADARGLRARRPRTVTPPRYSRCQETAVILIAGGTGTLGTRLVERLRARQLPVRVLTRHPRHAQRLVGEHVEVAGGDLRDPLAVDRAMTGVRTVISAVQGGFGATGGATPKSVDQQGNSHLIAAARAHQVEHFILLSIIDAGPDHPLQLWRMKYLAEQELKASGLSWTIISPAAFMEWALAQYGDPLLRTGRTWIFGRGNMPINFVSADDVAGFVE